MVFTGTYITPCNTVIDWQKRLAPPQRVWRPVNLKAEFVDRIEKRRDQEFKDAIRKPPLGAYVENLLLEVIEEDELMKKYGPLLEQFSISPDKILIKDNRTGDVAELTFRDSVLYCNLDESTNCVHIGFAWAIPAVYKVMTARGEKKPPIRGKTDQ